MPAGASRKPEGEAARREGKVFYAGAGVLVCALLISALIALNIYEVKKLNSEIGRLAGESSEIRRELKVKAPVVPARAAKAATPKAGHPDAGSLNAGERLSAPLFSVDGIVSGQNGPVAIVGGGLYRKDDLVLGFRVVAIEADGIRVEKDGRTYRVGLRGRP